MVLARFRRMTPLVRRAMLLLLSLTLSVNGLGAAFGQSIARDCCRNHAVAAMHLENGPCEPLAIGEVPCEHGGPAHSSPIDQDAQHAGVGYCPHCVGLGSSAMMLSMVTVNSISTLTIPFEAPPYVGNVIPDERPSRLERPPQSCL